MSRIKKPKLKALRHYKVGKRIRGSVYALPDGREVYLAKRVSNDFFRNGEKTVSDALRKGKAAWAIDVDHLIQFRLEGIQFVGVHCTDTDDVYLTTLDVFNKHSAYYDFSDREPSQWARGRATPQRHLLRHLFGHRVIAGLQ